MKAWLKRAFAWCKAHWEYFVGALAVLFAVGAAVKTVREHNEMQLDEKARKDVERARAQLATQRAQRAELAGRVEARQEEIELLNAHIATTQRVIVQAYEATEEMTDAQVLDRFKSLGYD